ncbi:MAG: hypothetical protein APF76_14545 [Desulfitibacter sp. BRH_c19]|nr:MAG: hypothetical protein APF76_14545 [Desulfitibacter sp. BRH_c19]
MKKLSLLFLVILIGLLISACGNGALYGQSPPLKPSDDAPVVEPDVATETAEVAIYFSDWQAQHVIPEFRELESGETNLAKRVVLEFLKGPEQPHLHRTFPEDTELIGVEIKEEIAYVNFKSGISIPGTAGEAAAIRSLFLTLTDLPGVEMVQVLVEGRSDVSFGGHYLLSEPWERPEIVTYPVFMDEERAKWLQDRAEDGFETWRFNPEEVAAKEGRMLGFSSETEFELIGIIQDTVPTASVKAIHMGEEYIIEMIQPLEKGEAGVWMIIECSIGS